MSEKDVQISYGDGFEALLEVLAGARRPGSWCASGSLETPMPAVEVACVGMLSFPVPPAQARQLITDAADRAPYGRGDRTLMDKNVRNVWQIGADKVVISGKGWSAAFGELVQKIGENLGCEGIEVEAQFYKLVYEKGSFRRRTTAPQSPGRRRCSHDGHRRKKGRTSSFICSNIITLRQ